MLTKETPTTIAARLTVKSQGVENSLALTYNNKSYEEYDEFVKNPETFKIPEGLREDQGIAAINSALVLFLVKSFDDGTDKTFPLTLSGLLELETVWPGVLMGIVAGYHQSRAAQVEKN